MCKKVLAMYDVRGIQNYIYRTPHIKDAMGASIIIEDIIVNALEDACQKQSEEKTLKLDINDKDLDWEEGDDDNKIAKPFQPSNKSVQVLYIGGGNAYVMYKNKDLCVAINKKMSKYIIENTYSLQLATTYVEVTGDYEKDYDKLREEMNKVKANMSGAKPLGALPIMKTEIKTGYPAVADVEIDKYRVDISKETFLKLDEKNEKIKELKEDKFLENYINEGKDSRIAVVHIDGNNMAKRIAKQIENIKDYTKAVNIMRKISHNIKTSYNDTFDKMKKKFEDEEVLPNENIERFIRKIIVAGDDITYVCNAHIALETVRYFSENIAGKVMVNNDNLEELDEKEKKEYIKEYGFSICAGIAYIGSHFPFYTAYEVAEECCSNAKKVAKAEENRDGERIGNYVDFQICKNIHCRNLDRIRQEEYCTPTGENLLIRPYYIPTEYQYELEKNANKENDYTNLKKNIIAFSDSKNIPRSYVKDICNTYSLGKYQTNTLYSFLKSRKHKLPNGENEMYRDINGKSTALWYDAVEIMDYNLFILKDKENVNEI